MNSRPSTDLLIPKERQERETEKRVSVVYYLSRKGHLEHPHFVEVPLSCSQGLFLRDVINRLNFLRGKGMANMYSWSSKRSFKNGFVWHDLSENDLIPPTHGSEYILKGSELLRTSMSLRYCESIGSSEGLPGIKAHGDGCESPATMFRRNQSWNSFDRSHEYRVHKAEANKEPAGKSADAPTQTGDERSLKRSGGEEHGQCGGTRREHRRGGASKLSSSFSSEFLERVSGSNIVNLETQIRDQTAGNGRMKASEVLKQLVSCGSVLVKDCASAKSMVVEGSSVRMEHRGERAA